MLFDLVALAVFLVISLTCYFMFMQWIEQHGGGRPVPFRLHMMVIVSATSVPVIVVKTAALLFSLLV